MSNSAQRLLEELELAEKDRELRDKKEKELKAEKDALQRKKDIEILAAFDRTRDLLSAALSGIERLYKNNNKVKTFFDAIKNSEKTNKGFVLWHKKYGKIFIKVVDDECIQYDVVSVEYEIIFEILNLHRCSYDMRTSDRNNPSVFNVNSGFYLCFGLGKKWLGIDGIRLYSLYNIPIEPSSDLSPWELQLKENDLQEAREFLERLSSDPEFVEKIILENEEIKGAIRKHIKGLKMK